MAVYPGFRHQTLGLLTKVSSTQYIYKVRFNNPSMKYYVTVRTKVLRPDGRWSTTLFAVYD